MRKILLIACAAWAIGAVPARADPISVSILTAVGIGASATAVAVTTFILQTVATIALSAAGKLLAGKNKQGLQERQASVVQMSIGEVAPQVIYGRTLTGGSLADAFNYGGPNRTDWEVMVVIIADHEIEDLEGFYIGSDYYAFTANGMQPGFRNCLDIEFVNASRTAPPARFIADMGTRWTANDVLAGRTRVWVAYKANEEVWPQGRPGFRWLVKGRKCIDPRDPGAGRVWSENPAVCRYDYQRGVYAEDRDSEPGQLLIGRGLSEEETPASLSIAAANICDELVAIPDGTEPRYRIGAVIGADEPFETAEEMFASCMAGVIVQREGSVYVEPGHAKSPVFAITDADLLSPEASTFSEFLAEPERINSIIPRYIEPRQIWKDHSAPIRRDLADIASDGGPLEESLSMPFVTLGTQAGRNGEIARRLARLEKRASVVLGPRFSHIEDGDWGTYASAIHTGGEPITVRVEQYELGEGWNIALSLREISAEVYGDAPTIEDEAVAEDPEIGVVYGAVIQILSRTVAYPITSDETSITIAAFTGTLSAFPWTIAFPAHVETALSSDTIYTVFWSVTDEEYLFIPSTDTVSMETAMVNSGLVILGSQRTALPGGGYTPPPTPPPGREDIILA